MDAALRIMDYHAPAAGRWCGRSRRRRILRSRDGCRSFPRLRGARQVIAGEPAAEAVEAGIENALGDVGVVELVANLPFEGGGDADATDGVRVGVEPDVHARTRVREQGAEGVLVDDALVYGGWLEEGGEGTRCESIEICEGSGGGGEHLDGEGVSVVLVQKRLESAGQMALDVVEVYAPAGGVAVVQAEV